MNNFHTHTKRCNHAVGNEEDYVKMAIKCGYKKLGFSEHMPLPPKDNEWKNRMTPFELDNYVNEVLRLKEKYKDEIKIYLSLEFEYFDNRVEWVNYLIQTYPLDYKIAGNHFYNKVSRKTYYGNFKKEEILDKYFKTAKFILQSNKFEVFAHPDLYMDAYRDWDEDAKALAIKICDLANKNDVILEYNLAGIKNRRQYPHKDFWDVAISKGNKIIIGVDAHDPKDFMLGYHQKAIKKLQSLGANLVLDLML